MSYVTDLAHDLTSIRQYLLAIPLPELPAALRQLNQPTLLAINLSKGKSNQVFVHDLIDQHLPASNPSNFIKIEQPMINAFSALEVSEYNIYDAVSCINLNVMESVVDALLAHPKRNKAGNRMVAHTAAKVTDTNALQKYEVWGPRIGKTNPLMDAVIKGDLDVVNILLQAGADPDIVNEKSLNCSMVAELYKSSSPEFYLNFRALILTRGHQANLSTKPRGRGL